MMLRGMYVEGTNLLLYFWLGRRESIFRWLDIASTVEGWKGGVL